MYDMNMEVWEKIIIEWIHCLQIQKDSIKNITELQNGEFYINFLKLIKWKKHESYNQEDILKFLEAEYPSFKVNKNDHTEHLYIASLLLVYACQMLSGIHSLQYNMCDNLKHETQIRVKAFLEYVLPIGKDITKETMKEVILEVEDIPTTVNNRKTPPNRKTPIEKFSPVTCSTRSKKIMTDRIRELRDLKCNLAEERFTNAELRDDIIIQQEKIQKLQKKLKEKSMLVNTLREERMGPSTPQPSQIKEDDSQENYYKKYISDLESQLNKQQDEINKLEMDKDTLSKKLSCMQRTYVYYKENFTSCEQSLESLSNKIEVKDRELVELRIQNEELRARIKELDKNFNTEQSFEIEDLSLPTRSLNVSEALSSVIEIQLQEAKEESAILHAQVDTLKGKLDILMKDYKTAMESNRDLQKKMEILDQVQVELSNVQKRLEISNTDIVNLKAEKTSLIAQNEDLRNLLSSREKELSKIEQSYITLNTELSNSKTDMKSLNKLLEEEKTNSSNLNIALTQTKLQVTEHIVYIHKLTDERDLMKKTINSLEEKKKILYNDLNEFKKTVQDLKEINGTLEEQYKTMKTEANNNMESLKSENSTISFKFKNATDKLSLLQKEMNDTIIQVEFKEAQIHELLLNVSSLKAEKERLIHSHKKMLETKDKEIETKQEALLMSQAKIIKLKNEKSATEKKMEEIIINFQEVTSNQDAVLVTLQAALKEKCLHIEELQKQFNNCKKILIKKLEDLKSSSREYQIKIFNLENQISNQNKTIAELEEMLREMSAELETNREYYKQMDASKVEIIKLCQKLEHPTKSLNSTIMETCSDFDFLDHDLYYGLQYEYAYTDDKIVNILNIIKMTFDELHKSQKIILHLSSTNTALNKALAEQKILIENNIKDKKEICSLKTKIRELEVIGQKRNNYLKNLIQIKESLKDPLQKVIASLSDSFIVLTSFEQKWNEILTKVQHIICNESSICDELKQLEAKKASHENTLSKYQIAYLKNIKFVFDILWDKFLWTEQQLHDTYLCSIHEKECLDALTSVEKNEFADDKVIIDVEIEKNKTLQTNIIKFDKEIQAFMALATFYESNLKSDDIKNRAEVEKKLQNQINQLTNEKKDQKNKMDTMRSRIVKLEKNIDDLRMEIKNLKSVEIAPTEINLEMQSLRDELKYLKEQNQQLHEEKDESSKIAKQELENRIKKEILTMYEQKLEDMKQKMKIAYNEQMTKLNKDREKIIEEKIQTRMEIMCQKQAEEINQYSAHVERLSSECWTLGEKILIKEQQKQDALQLVEKLKTNIKELKANQPITISRKTYQIEKQETSPENMQQTAMSQKVTTRITEETFERKHNLRSMQAMGNVFKSEDEEEIFDNVYLADIKRGKCLPTQNERLSILQMRNSLCKPHLKSSYPAEMQFLPSTLTEEEIKTGSPVEDNFNDSLSQSLLPEQKARKKDRSQISYKKPGPPTPSKNGGRLSLQSNDLKSPSSRILRERNIDRKTTTTPHSLKNIFSLKRQDENASSTPKRRLSSLFRKSRFP